jgi:hypothetical protein
MIKYNYEYTYSRGNGKITFTEGKAGIVNATYKVFNDIGTITGKLDENKLEATFHSTSMNRVGLIYFTFSDNGFDAKWKNGLEPGAMRGRWFTEKQENKHEGSDILESYSWNWTTIAEFSGIEDPISIEDYSTLKDNFNEYHDILNELAEDGTIDSNKTNIKLYEVVQEAGRLFGKLAWLAARNNDSSEYWCRKWASFIEFIAFNCSPNSADFLALGQQYHMEYQPLNDENNYPEDLFIQSFENADSVEDLINLFQYGLFSEYHNFESLANDCIRKAWQMEKTIDIAVQLISDDNEEKRPFLEEDLFEEILNEVREMEDTEDGEWTKSRFEELIESF